MDTHRKGKPGEWVRVHLGDCPQRAAREKMRALHQARKKNAMGVRITFRHDEAQALWNLAYESLAAGEGHENPEYQDAVARAQMKLGRGLER